MWRHAFPLLLWALPIQAQTDLPPPIAPTGTPLTCAQASVMAEFEQDIPKGLLLAIGRIESGRADPLTGLVAPWPWTTNVAGAGHFYPSKDEAVAAVSTQRAAGIASIDTGCFQVNLFYHPAAFADVAEAFDPLANARYAARFLAQLRARTGSWEGAVAAYHSSIPAEGGWYRDRVLASWHGGPLVVAPRYRQAFAQAPLLDDPHVVLVSTGLRGGGRGIQVWGPHGLLDGGGEVRSARMTASRGRLPRVIGP